MFADRNLILLGDGVVHAYAEFNGILNLCEESFTSRIGIPWCRHFVSVSVDVDCCDSTILLKEVCEVVMEGSCGVTDEIALNLGAISFVDA